MRIRTGSLLMFLVVLSAAAEPFARLWQSPATAAVDRMASASSESRPGETRTLLSDGRVLVLGGEEAGEPTAVATIEDPKTREREALPRGLRRARAWHTATVLPDGQVLIFGGVGRNGQLVRQAERFDPETRMFRLSAIPLTRRAGHTATLLTDGRLLIVGGWSNDGDLLPSTDLWDTEGSRRSAVVGALRIARDRHLATLLATGGVLVRGGFDATGQPIAEAEAFDPKTERFGPVEEEAPPASVTRLEASAPSDGATDVPLRHPIALRLSTTIASDTVTPESVTLTGSEGSVDLKLVVAEAGMLVFATPRTALRAGTTYTLGFAGLLDTAGRRVEASVIHFTTRADDLSERPPVPVTRPGAVTTPSPAPPSISIPSVPIGDSGSSSEPGKSEALPTQPRPDPFDPTWESLPPLRGLPGVTALAGQVLQVDGRPIPNATLAIESEGRTTQSDETGRFLLSGLSCTHCVLFIDGRNTSVTGISFGVFEFGYDVIAGQTNMIMPLWMPQLDVANSITIPSPTSQELVLTTPRIPGLELHLPAGAVVRDRDGQLVTQITITPFSQERPIMPPPPGRDFPVFFAIQPDGARVESPSGKGAWLVYPNATGLRAGRQVPFLTYDPNGKEWFVYGTGRVSADGQRIVPDPDTTFDTFRCTPDDPNQGIPPDESPGEGDCSDNTSPEGGDPCSLSTGLFVYRKTDLAIADLLPISVMRTYQTEDPEVRAFGVGMTDEYTMFLFSPHEFHEMNLVLPNGAVVHYRRISSGDGFQDAVFEHSDSPTARFFMSRITWDANRGWDLSLKDGTVYVFNDSYHLVAIRDRYGNQITVTRALDAKGHPTGHITRITSPSGRFIDYSYDSKGRISTVTDNSGRDVSYAYDDSGHLQSATDPLARQTIYRYGQASPSGLTRMQKITDARDIDYLYNEFDTTTGRVLLQHLPIGGGIPIAQSPNVYQFFYSTDASGHITNTTVLDPRGVSRSLTFNANGHVLVDEPASSGPEGQTTTFERDPATDLVTSVRDALARRTTFDHDAMGNVTKVTRMAGTSEAASTTFTYEAFNQPHTITDPLGHTTTMVHDVQGHLTDVIDALGNRTTMQYNDLGLVTSTTDPLGNVTRFFYNGGDQVAVMDPLGNVNQRLYDAVGRPVSLIDPLGHVKSLTYDPLNNVTATIGPLGSSTSYSYDENGNLKVLTDPLGNETTYSPTVTDEVGRRTDPLGRVDHYTYDPLGDLLQVMSDKPATNDFKYDGLGRRTFAGFGLISSPPPTYESTVTYTYDAGNRLRMATDSTFGTIVRTYDDFDRLASEASCPNGMGPPCPLRTVSYTYDTAGRRATMSIPGQAMVTYTYDDANRLASLKQGTATVAIAYDAASRRSSVTLPNGVSMTYGYDAASRLTSIAYRRGATQFGDLTYTYDAAGRRTSVGGSWARASLPTAVTAATYDATNQLTTWGRRSLFYDGAGNTSSDGRGQFAWNARSQLTELTRSGTNATFAYDPLGRRVMRNVNGSVTQYLYDGLNPVQELDDTGSVKANLLTGGLDEYFARTESGGTPRYFLTDALHSTVALANKRGDVTTEYTYDPFGAATTQDLIGASDNSLKYTGREDDGTSLYY